MKKQITGIAEAAGLGARAIAKDALKLSVPQMPAPQILFGVKEAVLLFLFALYGLGQRRGFRFRKQHRRLSLFIGLVVFGFLYNTPLTLAFVNKMIPGFWLQWQTHLFWYLLFGGFLFFLMFKDRNPYCRQFCPFGAAREYLGAIGGAKPRSPGQYAGWLKWMPRVLALLAIMVAMMFRNPGLSGYEVFGTLFNLTGSTLQFVLLGLILGASLLIHTPWCKYLCPIRSVGKYIRLLKNWIMEPWKKKRRET